MHEHIYESECLLIVILDIEPTIFLLIVSIFLYNFLNCHSFITFNYYHQEELIHHETKITPLSHSLYLNICAA
jgi:hypothetical protein